MASPLASPPLVRKTVHIPDPHFCHVGCLRCGDRLEAVPVFLEAECAVDGVATDDKAQGAEDDDEDDDEGGQGVAGVVAGDEGGHGDRWLDKSMQVLL